MVLNESFGHQYATLLRNFGIEFSQAVILGHSHRKTPYSLTHVTETPPQKCHSKIIRPPIRNFIELFTQRPNLSYFWMKDVIFT